MKIISSTKKYWYNLSRKLRFALIGCINAVIMYAIYTFFILILGTSHYQVSLALAWIFSSMTSFFLHKVYVFHSKNNILKEYLKCCLTWIISYFINAILLEFLVKYICLDVFISQIIAPAIAGIFTYIIFKTYTFKK